MPKGTPLAPGTAEKIGELYAQFGNLSGVARLLNLPFETVRDVIARGSNARRRQLLEQALALGLEEGAEHLRESATRLRDALVDNADAGEGIGPGDMHHLASGLASLVGAQARARDTITRTRNAAKARAKATLEMQKLELEIARLREGGDALTAEERAALRGMLARRPAPEADDGNDRRGADPPVAGDAARAGDPDPPVGPGAGGG